MYFLDANGAIVFRPDPNDFSHRYIRVRDLVALLNQADPDDIVVVGPTGNLAIGRLSEDLERATKGLQRATRVGYIDLGTEEFDRA